MTTRMTIDDLFSGLFASLAQRGFLTFSIRTDQVDTAMEKVFRDLQEQASAHEVDLRFHLVRDPLHGESDDVREALTALAQRDLISIDNPEYQDIRLKQSVLTQTIDPDSIPGGSALFDRLASIFIDSYEPVA